MKLPSYLDFANLLLALPYSAAEPSGSAETEHEEFRLTLLAPTPPGLPTKPLGYLLLVYLAHEAMRSHTREVGSTLAALCRSMGAHELADQPKPVEDQLVRLSQTLIRVEVAGPKGARTALFPFLSQLILDASDGGAKRRWHARLSGDFHRVLRHTAPAAIAEAQLTQIPF
jgi:hypothetical protein